MSFFHALLSAGVSSSGIVAAFRARVEADSGTFEGDTCLEDVINSMGLNFYNNASFIVTPNGYKTSKLYSLKPTNGGGDFTFARSTTGYRKNATRLQEMSADVPRVDFLNDTCPSVLLEPQRTNIILRSQDLSSATWTKFQVTAGGPELTGANGIWIDGNYAYVAAFTGDTLEIIDISDPLSPQHVGSLVNGAGGALLNGPVGVHVVGNYAFVSSNVSNAIEVVDITDKVNPVHAGSIVDGAGGAELTGVWNMDIVGNYLYVVCSGNALEIIDISTPTSPTHVGKLTTGFNVPTGIEVVGNYAYICNFNSDSFCIVDVSNPASPTMVSTLNHGTGGALLLNCHGVWVVGNYAYVVARASNALNIIDISNPASPTVVSTLVDGSGGAELSGAENIQVIGNYAYIACFTGDALEIVDISNPAAPAHVGKIVNGTGGSALDDANRVFVSGNYAYVVAAVSNALEIVDISAPTNPIHVSKVLTSIGRYKIRETSVTNFHFTRQVLTKSASSLSYIFAIVVKGGYGRDYICLQADDASNGVGRFFNITTGTLGGTRTFGSGFTLLDSKIVNLGDEGYLCMIRATTSTSTTLEFTVLLSTDGTTISYAGDTTKGFYFDKQKIIQSTAPLTDSFIQTTSASVTRNADVLTPLTSVTSLIGQTEGTIFFWVRNTWADAVSKAISISDGTANNSITLDFTTGNVINALVVSSGVTQATISNAGFSNLTEYKVAITYQNNKAALFVNGSKIGEDLTVTVPACSRIGFDSGAGSNPFYGNIESFGILKTALSDASAQSLTTI